MLLLVERLLDWGVDFLELLRDAGDVLLGVGGKE